MAVRFGRERTLDERNLTLPGSAIASEERLQKILSRCGVASRRHAESAIAAGRVRVNGKIATLGQKANPQRDRIELDGRPVRQPQQQPLYLLLHKPAGTISTCSDPRGRRTILDLLPDAVKQGRGVHPIGRLDADSTGALLLTDDGAFTNAVAHPRYHIPKTYRVWVEGRPPEAVLERWRTGVELDGRPTLPARVEVVDARDRRRTRLEIVLSEGRNRQIRRVAALLGYPVTHLHRTAIGPVQLQSPHQPMLPRGRYRPLKEWEIRSLRSYHRQSIADKEQDR